MRHIRWAESNRIFQLGSTVLNGNNMLGAIAVICYSSTHFICRGATCSSQITLRTSFFVRGNIFYNWTSLVCQQDADFWHYPRNVALSFYYRHTHTHTHTQPFYHSLDFFWDNPCEPVPEATFTHLSYCCHQLSLICFVYVLQSMTSSLFNLRSWQSFSTISLHVFFRLPLGLAPPLHTPYNIINYF